MGWPVGRKHTLEENEKNRKAQFGRKHTGEREKIECQS